VAHPQEAEEVFQPLGPGGGLADGESAPTCPGVELIDRAGQADPNAASIAAALRATRNR
jgi:hypothetical protein